MHQELQAFWQLTMRNMMVWLAGYDDLPEYNTECQ